MDDIQKTLVKAGRKDLAQEYYKKVIASCGKDHEEKQEDDEAIEEKMLPGVHYNVKKRKK